MKKTIGKRLVTGATIGVVGVTMLTACGTPTSVNMIGLRYSYGSVDGDQFMRVIEPGAAGEFTVNDNIYRFPVDQRTYNVCDGGDKQGCDAPVITVPAKDQPELDISIASAFMLNTRTDDIKGFPGGTLRRFYETVCKKVHCVEADDPDNETGWNKLLKERYRPALEAALRDVVSKYNADDLVYNRSVAGTNGAVARPARELVSEEVGPLFLKYLTTLVGGAYFCGPTFTREKNNGCPPIQLTIRGADYHDDDVKRSRLALKIAQDRGAAAKAEAQAAVEARKKFGTTREYIAYLNALAALECAKRSEKCVMIVNSGDTPVSVSLR